ncbi:hypothetical protein H2200_011448 [Cladophialophora chaetospira]|uniref:Uncharacterized protein n=1 Tax=Cladophialophora chaetospira TaxID=386627 RepID=A0AA38WZB3_9EURO|nr:hypothetical protein H2200_011448 [Cladophialophora chaetospira]
MAFRRCFHAFFSTFMLAFVQITLALNNCQARELICFIVPNAGHPPNIEMLIDRIPDGSIDSICGSFAKTINENPEGNLTPPGCHTAATAQHQGSQDGSEDSNTIVFSTSDTSLETRDSLSNFLANAQSLFDQALQCQKTDFAVPCPELSTIMPPPPGGLLQGVDVSGSGAQLSQIGNSINVGAAGAVTITLNLVAVPDASQTDFSQLADIIDLSSQVEQEVAVAVTTISQTINQFIGSTSNAVGISPCESGIGFAGAGFLKVLIDRGITASGHNAATLMASDQWNTVISRLVDLALNAGNQVAGAGYSTTGQFGPVDFFVALAVGALH